MTDRELMQMALDALMRLEQDTFHPAKVFPYKPAIEALRARLAQPEPEPWGYISHKSWKMPVFVKADDLEVSGLPFNNPDYTPVYKAPPQREWQGLTDEELLDIADMAYANDLELLQTLQAKLKEKNHG